MYSMYFSHFVQATKQMYFIIKIGLILFLFQIGYTLNF